MFRYFAESIVFILIRNKILSIENRDVYVYGMEVILLNTILMLTLLGISIVGNGLVYFWGFLLFFVPIRTFAGGYHAKRSETCMLTSVGVYTVGMFVYKHFPNLYTSTTILCLFLMACSVLLLCSPHENVNHPLTELQRKRNRQFVWGIVIVDIIVFVIFSILNYTIASCEALFLILASGFLVVGKIQKQQSQ